MKRYVLVVMICVSTFPLIFAQQWYPCFVPHGRDISASYITRPDAVMLAGGHEQASNFEDFFLSYNYGQIWNVAGTGVNGSLVRCITFKDQMNGYGVCNLGKMVRTVDGGNSWTNVDSVKNRNFFKVIYVTPQTMFIAGGAQTLDTATILKSTDGGNSWVTVYNQPGSRLKSICFTDVLHGLAVGENSEMLRTTNGGLNWVPVIPPVADRNFNDIAFSDADSGYIIGGIRDSLRTLLKTIDGGQNWSVLQNGPGGELTDIMFLSATTGYIVGDSAAVLQTTDGGLNWIGQSIPNTNPGQRINTVFFYNSDLGVIGGEQGYGQLFTTAAAPQVITLNATLHDSSTATIASKINTHGAPSECYIFISIDSNFIANVIFSSTGLTSDSLKYVTATFNNLQPGTRYYYYAAAASIVGLVNGDTMSFIAANPSYRFEALQATGVTTVAARMLGFVQNMPAPVTISFDYGTNQPTGNSIAATPVQITDTAAHGLMADLNQLPPSTTYTYRLRGETSAGVFFSPSNGFRTLDPPSHYVTLPASYITNTSAQLNGMIFQTPGTTAVSFDYGNSLSFANNIVASPDIIYDSLQHSFTAQVSGLQSNTLYYFRLKAVNAGVTSYGDTLQFYTSASTIPNWDFENWTHFIYYTARYWYFYGNVNIVPSYNGSKAMYLSAGNNVPGGTAFTGIPFSGMDPLLGSAFTVRPDSVYFFANYDIPVGDTGAMVLMLKKNGVPIATSQYPLTGSTGNSFIRIAAALQYSAPGNPDSVIMAFASSLRVFNDQPGNNTGWLAVDDVSFSGTAQTVVNAGFEDVDTVDYDRPDFWYAPVDAPVNLMSGYPIQKTNDAYSGNFAAKIVTPDVPALNMRMKGFLSTKGDGGAASPNFPVPYRVQELNGYFKYLPDANDTMGIDLMLFKNGMQVGSGTLRIDTVTSDYKLFSLPVYYNNTTDIPDSGLITISTCREVVYGHPVLYIDKLGFDGTTGAVGGLAAGSSKIVLFPNPASDQAYIKPGWPTRNWQLEVFDLNGALLRTARIKDESFNLSLRDLATGTYLLRIA